MRVTLHDLVQNITVDVCNSGEQLLLHEEGCVSLCNDPVGQAIPCSLSHNAISLCNAEEELSQEEGCISLNNDPFRRVSLCDSVVTSVSPCNKGGGGLAA